MIKLELTEENKVKILLIVGVLTVTLFTAYLESSQPRQQYPLFPLAYPLLPLAFLGIALEPMTLWHVRKMSGGEYLLTIFCTRCNHLFTSMIPEDSNRVACKHCGGVYMISMSNPHSLSIKDITKHVERYEKTRRKD